MYMLSDLIISPTVTLCRAHVASMISGVVHDYGFSFLKLDFLHVAALPGLSSCSFLFIVIQVLDFTYFFLDFVPLCILSLLLLLVECSLSCGDTLTYVLWRYLDFCLVEIP